MAEKAPRLPPYCGQGLSKEFLYNPYQVELLKARRLRICPRCANLNPVNSRGVFECPSCGLVEASQLIARKAFRRIGIVGGRRSGKTLVGAHAAREEMIVPGGLGWVCGPTYKVLHDSTIPTLCKIIPPNWVKHWDGNHLDLTLVNNHVIQFRSLDDPTRAVGMGPTWSWFDEVQKILEKAWDIFRPSLTDNLGNTIFTWTPNGFDWTWRRLWRAAAELHEPGFWMAKCRTLDNPWIQRYGLEEVEEARRTMPPQMFRQEYEADFVSFVGNVYDWETIEPAILRDAESVRAFIPEWPQLDPSRQYIMGMSGEPSAPFAGVLLALTDRGFVAVGEYLDEHRSVAYHYDAIKDRLLAQRDRGQVIGHVAPHYGADEEYPYLMIEGSRKGIGIIPTEHYLMTGVQRVHSWMYTNQLYYAYTCPKLLDQMQGYRWHDPEDDDGQKSEHERVFRKDNELPNALRAGLLASPSLPTKPTLIGGRDLSAHDERMQRDIARMAAHDDREKQGDDLAYGAKNWPWGGLHGDVDPDS